VLLPQFQRGSETVGSDSVTQPVNGPGKSVTEIRIELVNVSLLRIESVNDEISSRYSFGNGFTLRGAIIASASQ